MQPNIVSVSWGDHLEFGEGDGALDSPGAIERSMDRWRDKLEAGIVLWREARLMRKYARRFSTPDVTGRAFAARPQLDMDEHQVVIDAAHARGMQAYLYVTMFDEGWPRSLEWRGGYEGWQSYHILRHPDHQLVDRSGQEVLHGVICYAYPEVRRYKLDALEWLLERYDWDGVFYCTRSQSRPARHADQFGFNDPVVREYRARYGIDIRASDFDVEQWRRLHGEYLTTFFREVKDLLSERGLTLAVGIPRASYLGPPIGNIHLDWPTWVREGIVDKLVIDQVAAICPSTWTWLWSGDQGYGYVENHIQGNGTPPLVDDVEQRWSPVIEETDASLYLARMWSEFDADEQQRLTALPGVDGLVFSSFRYDNPAIAARNLWAM